MTPVARLDGRQKATALLLALGPDLAAQVIRSFSDPELERLAAGLLATEPVAPEVQQQVVAEAYQLALLHRSLARGGVAYARQVLEQAVGRERAEELLAHALAYQQPHPLGFLRNTDPVHLASFLNQEHPQLVALVLAHLSPPKAAAVLRLLPTELQGEVAVRLATMDRAAPEVVQHLARAMERKLSLVLSHDSTTVGGADFLVKVLHQSDRGTEKSILDWLDRAKPSLAETIRQQLFVFEDLSKLDDRSLQRVLREVDLKDLALALKNAPAELREKVLHNLSARAADLLQEELELLGQVRRRLVEEAQHRIVEVVRRLEQAEEIVVSRGPEEELV